MEFNILEGILLLLTSAVVVAALFHRINLPSTLGYLVVGLIVGPYALALIPNTDATQDLAEFGVVFLMFTIGLEFSLPKLLSMKRIVFGLGGLQVILTLLSTVGISLLFGSSLPTSIIIGSVVAMSSTAIVIKQLNDQMEVNTPYGSRAVGILLFQDIAVIPLLILIPSLGGEGNLYTPMLWAFAKAIVVMIAITLSGRWILRPLFREIASTRSMELFTLTILLVTLGSSWLTEHMGLSMTLGAFLAGMMLGETEFRHQIEVEIRPFRDVLLGLFFITIGMLLDLHALPDIWVGVLILLAILILFKTILISLLSRLMGAKSSHALQTGLILAHGGEFGFALLTIAMTSNLLTDTMSQTILAALVFSMAASPFLIRFHKQISQWLLPKASKLSDADTVKDITASTCGLNDHVIICGFGRVGQNIARFLETEGFQFIALDMDPIRVQQAQLAGERVDYGDSSNFSILMAAGIFKAKAVIISFDDIHATKKILPQVRKVLPDLPILVRTRDDSQTDNLQEAGATQVVPETLEASLMLAFHMLILMDVPPSRALRQIRDIRARRYDVLTQVFPSHEMEDLEDVDSEREHLYVVSLSDKAGAVGRRLSDIPLDNVTVTALCRAGIRSPDPGPETMIKENDVLVLHGLPPNLEQAERCLLQK